MLRKIGTLVLISLALPLTSARAAGLPELLTSPTNSVPECATPGRMMALLKLRNRELDTRYNGIAVDYMREGERFGLRWDFAFYQMIVETGALSYWRGNRSGDVKPSQNNFAGLGATGRGVPGESFTDVATGVRAHLEHLMLYAGKPVDNPVAERTRKVREWNVLTAWQQRFNSPITYTDLGTKWAPGTKRYAGMLRAVADQFRSGVCGAPDPQPHLVQEARGGVTALAAASNKEPGVPPARTLGTEIAQKAIEAAKVDGVGKRSALGAGSTLEQGPPSAPFKVLNPPPAASDSARPVAKVAASDAVSPLAQPVPKAGGEKTAIRSAVTMPPVKQPPPEALAPPPASQKCRVWTASYGGQKAIIIRSVADQMVNFHVLDVHEGSEEREAAAFIQAYAKNGKVAGEFPNQSQALEKAFALCPEG
jgi:hypothetical protein